MNSTQVELAIPFPDIHNKTDGQEKHIGDRMRRQVLSTLYSALVLAACFVQGYSLPQLRRQLNIISIARQFS